MKKLGANIKSKREQIIHKLLPRNTLIVIFIDGLNEVLDLSLITLSHNLLQLVNLNIPRMIAVKVLKSFMKGLFNINLIFIVHGNNELIKVYFARVILIHRRNQLI